MTTTVAFDALDRLTTDGATSYTYDGLDRVATRGTQAFTYTGLTNDLTADGTATYSRDPNGTLLALAQGTTKTATLSDRHSDLVATFNPTTGAVTDSTSFDPFGQVTATAGAAHTLGYQGAYTDPATGKANMAARWYQPDTGSFASRDDITLTPQPSTNTNRYTYTGADPLDHIDPSGHDSIDDACVADDGGPGPRNKRAGRGRGNLFANIIIGFICDARPTQSGCLDSDTDGYGNLCPHYYRDHPQDFPYSYRNNPTFDPGPTVSPSGDCCRPSAPDAPRKKPGNGGGGYKIIAPEVPHIDWGKIIDRRANEPHPRPPAPPTIAPDIQKIIDDDQPAINIHIDIPSNNQIYQPSLKKLPKTSDEVKTQVDEIRTQIQPYLQAAADAAWEAGKNALRLKIEIPLRHSLVNLPTPHLKLGFAKTRTN